MQENLTFSLAVLGAVLGVINTWRAIDRDRLKLSVTPSVWFGGPGNAVHSGLCIEVVNLSTISVTITELSICAGNPGKGRFLLPVLRYSGCEGLPHRLGSREAITVFFPPHMEHDPGNELDKARRAYAKTACGRHFVGNSPALKQWLSNARKIKQ